MEKEFDLVLILEMLDESLILMKDMFCWDLKDIAYFKLNERTDESKSQMTERTQRLLKQWLWGDYKLYNYFKSKLLQKIQDFGTELMIKQLRNLRLANEQLHSACHSVYTNNSDLKGTLFYMASNRVKGLALDSNCALYAISELNFFRVMRAKQNKMFS